MKRILALLLALTMTFSLALAENAAPVYSQEVIALKSAITAIRGQYGLSVTSMGLFFPQFEVTEDRTVITFRSADFMPMDRLGEYTVTITGNQAEVSWTHDDKDPQLWQSGNPESPCWGDKQMQAYFDQGIGDRDLWAEKYMDPAQGEVDFPDLLDTIEHTFIPTERDAMPSDALQALGKQTLMDVYDLTAEEITAMDTWLEPGIIQTADGGRYWHLTYADVYGNFTLMIDVQTHTIFKLRLFTGGRG